MRNQSWKLEHNNALPYIMIYKNMLRPEVKTTTLQTEYSTKLLQIKLDRIVRNTPTLDHYLAFKAQIRLSKI